MNNSTKKLIENQIAKLRADNDYLARQIPFLAQRLEDMKKTLADNIKEVVELQDTLAS